MIQCGTCKCGFSSAEFAKLSHVGYNNAVTRIIEWRECSCCGCAVSLSVTNGDASDAIARWLADASDDTPRHCTIRATSAGIELLLLECQTLVTVGTSFADLHDACRHALENLAEPPAETFFAKDG